MKNFGSAHRIGLNNVFLCFVSVCGLVCRAQAQVVQLPTYRSFSYGGSVTVPDGGAIDLGAVRHAALGSRTQGGLGISNRGLVGRSGIGFSSLSVEVIDLDALDQVLLSANSSSDEWAPGDSKSPAMPSDDAERARQFIANYKSILGSGDQHVSGDSRWTSSRELQFPGREQPVVRGAMVQESLAEENLRYYLERGREAEKLGRLQAAQVYYRLAIQSMSPSLRQRYLAILQRRENSSSGQDRNRRHSL